MAGSRFAALLTILLLAQLSFAQLTLVLPDAIPPRHKDQTVLAAWQPVDLREVNAIKVMNEVHQYMKFGSDLFVISAQRQLVNGYLYRINYEHAGSLIQVVALSTLDGSKIEVKSSRPIKREDL